MHPLLHCKIVFVLRHVEGASGIGRKGAKGFRGRNVSYLPDDKSDKTHLFNFFSMFARGMTGLREEAVYVKAIEEGR